MKTITKLSKIIELGKEAEDEGKKLYIRWSRGPELDKRQGASMDYTNYSRHNGLSAQPVRHDDPELLARMIPEYRFLRRKDAKIYCWIFAGEQNGVDTDNAPTIDSQTVQPIGRLSEELIEKCSDFDQAYNGLRNYAYNPSKPEHYERNARIDQAIKLAWEQLD